MPSTRLVGVSISIFGVKMSSQKDFFLGGDEAPVAPEKGEWWLAPERHVLNGAKPWSNKAASQPNDPRRIIVMATNGFLLKVMVRYTQKNFHESDDRDYESEKHDAFSCGVESCQLDKDGKIPSRTICHVNVDEASWLTFSCIESKQVFGILQQRQVDGR